MSAKKPVVEVHKFGGASLGDGAAYRHAVAIVKGRPGAPVVVVSAPAGVTDVLLGLATRAVAGERAAEALTATSRRCASATATIADAPRSAAPRWRRRRRRGVRPPRSTARSTSWRAAVQPGRAEGADAAHARLRGQPRRAPVGADLRGGLAAAGTPPCYVDATEIVFTDGPVRRRVAQPGADRPGGAQEAAAADRGGQGPGRPRLHRQRAHRGRARRGAPRSGRWPRSGAAAPT